jgi:hypothetical protein
MPSLLDRAVTSVLACLLFVHVATAQAPTATRQTQADDYTRYELLAPESGKFRILYEVTATTPGATEFYNVIRRGSVASDERVVDLATGKALDFAVVSADVARAGGVRNADSTTQYIRVKLARPVSPSDGEGRILIDKTYYDPKSYFEQNGEIVFTRSLGIKRNAVVLPIGYELVSCNYPSQVLRESDGRIAISFWNNTPAEAPLQVRARRGRSTSSSSASSDARLTERAHQSREIVYELQQPETHAFDLYHDYTESRPGTSTYVNVVRQGSSVSRPRARNLDTGEELRFDVLQGSAITAANLDVQNVTPATQAVVFRFTPVPQGHSVRIRMYETYTDSSRYKVVNGELIWDRSFGRPANAVILPDGWTLSNSSIPAVVSTTSDGRTRLDFINPRPDEISVLVTARYR